MSEKKIGVFICHCGSNIAGVVDIEKVMNAIRELPNVEVIEDYKYVCSKPGQQILKDYVKNRRLDRVVIAACSNRTHDSLFQRVVRQAGLNPFLVELVNLREQCV